ncbi:response regulator [Alicyclobacillus sp. ALC3]|uniref:response regulator n=1 Tax=Alicyclobacillus sp. ALC3 TaxID=2796143 RepID=UPI00237802C8|nr:response regulator transcription factor [Alicyclobacillus sp. ALC3]WDL99120.1 response regulator transcription factor [Alicyclobacillus sp. ALC3]
MSEENTRIRVAIVDDHPVVREGLRAFLQLAGDITVVCELDTGEAAVQVLQDTHLAVDVVVMDLKMPGPVDGVEAIRRLRNLRPGLKLLALTSFQDRETAISALAAGAVGYLHKDVPPDLLLGGIRQAAAGRMVMEQTAWAATQASQPERLPRVHSEQAVGDSAAAEPLTDREHDVLQAMAHGLSNKEIGGTLGISEKTVKVHVSHILSKLGVLDRTQAVLLAAKRGMVEI